MARQIAVADAETNKFQHGATIEPFIWGFYDGQTYLKFTSTIAFIEYVYNKKIIVFFHNGGKFDFYFLKFYMECYTKYLIIQGRISQFKIGECEFRDSYNLLPTPLDAYDKTEIDYDIFEPSERYKTENWRKITAYLKDDCVNLYNYVRSFIDHHNLNSVNLTLAGTAMAIWRRMSKKAGVTHPRDTDGRVFTKFSPFYYGGRTECLEYGVIKAAFKMADIKSAYPEAMCQMHPYGLDYLSITEADFKSLTRNQRGTCFLTLKCISKGAFPYRRPEDREARQKLKEEGTILPRDDALYFPRDNEVREYNVTGWEYLAGLKTKTIKQVEIKTIWYFPEQISFSQYVNHFYEAKEKAKKRGDAVMALINKLLLNALYGKYGSNPFKYHNYMSVPYECIDHNGVVKTGRDEEHDYHFSAEFGGYALVKKKLENREMRFFNVATAASITGYVRAKMWIALCRCERPLYCDTDSIAAVKFGKLPGGFGKKLGQWEIEGEFSEAALGGKKLYALKFASNRYIVKSEKIPFKKEEIIKAKKGKGKILFEKGALYKVASKGVRLKPHQFYKVARGHTVLYKAETPTFSINREPYYVTREVRRREALYGLLKEAA